MDAQDIRNLQEAYMEVVMTEGVVDSPYDRAQTDRADTYGRAQTDRADAYGRAQKKKKQKTQKEQVDIYDIILSHLLDEGYAETQEAAEVIMVNMSEDWRDSIVEATAMAKRGYDEAPIRQRIAKSTGGGEAADRAKALADRQTYGDEKTAKARQRLARIQVGDFRKTTSSSPGLHGYAHKSDDPEVKAKQAARGAQRGALTPREKKQLGR